MGEYAAAFAFINSYLANQTATGAFPGGISLQSVALDTFSLGDAVFGAGLPGDLSFNLYSALANQAVDYVLLSASQLPCVLHLYPGAQTLASLVLSVLSPVHGAVTGALQPFPFAIPAVYTSLVAPLRANATRPSSAYDIADRVVSFQRCFIRLLSSDPKPAFG